MDDRFKPESVIGMGQNMHPTRTFSVSWYLCCGYRWGASDSGVSHVRINRNIKLNLTCV